MSNLPGESSLKTVESGFANFKTRADLKKNRAELVKEQASAKSEINWIFTLVVFKLNKSWKNIRWELLQQFHAKLGKLAYRTLVLEKLHCDLKVQNKENEPLCEGLESGLYLLMTLCDQLNEKFQHLRAAVTRDEARDSQLGAIDMAKALFQALDNMDDLFSRLVSSDTTVGNRTSCLKSIESRFANFETCAVRKKNHAVKEQASANSETNWVFNLIVKVKKIEEHIRMEFLHLYRDELEKLKKFIHVLEKLEHELKEEHKVNEKLWEGLESEFSSLMTLCDQLNGKFQHLHDAATADGRRLYEEELSPAPMLDRRLGAIEMVGRLFTALEKLDDLCSRLVSPETIVGNWDKGLRKIDIENGKVEYNQYKVPSRTLLKGKRTSPPVEDKGESSLKSVESGFTNFKTRPDRKKNRAVKEQASANTKTYWIFDLVVKLKKSREHIRVELPDRFHDKLEKLGERIHVLEKLRYAIKVQDKENEQLWEGLESEFSSIMTLCDQLNKKYQHLHDAVTIDETGDDQLGAIDMANGLFHALDKLDDLFSRLASSETTVGNRINMIDINSGDILAEQLGIASMSHTPVVMLFYSKDIIRCKYYLPNFDDLPNQYRHFDGDINFFRVESVDVKRAYKEFKIKDYPTVLVMMPGSCGLRVVGRLSIEETVIVPAFVMALKRLLNKCLWEYCGYMGVL